MPPPRTSPGILISQRWFYTSYSTWERLEQWLWRVLFLAFLSPPSLPLNSFLWLWWSLYKKGPRVPDRLNAARAQKTTLSTSWSLSSVSCFTKNTLAQYIHVSNAKQLNQTLSNQTAKAGYVVPLCALRRDWEESQEDYSKQLLVLPCCATVADEIL